MALLAPAVAGACTVVAVRIADHPGYVRTVTDFTGGTISSNQVSATDPLTMDGTAALVVVRRGVRTQVPAASGDGVKVSLIQGSGRLRIAIRAAKGRFKYLSYVRGDPARPADAAQAAADGIVRCARSADRARYELPGMTERESAEYVRHHLQLAGRKDNLFSDGALELLHASRAGSRGS